MKSATRALVLLGIAAAGCRTAHNVVTDSHHAVTAPVRLVDREDSGKPPAPTSDVDVPGQPVAPTPTPTPGVARSNPSPQPSPSASPHVASNPTQFPVAKAVPGKPGLVYNPFDPNGGLIDVSGYSPGSKVKDPDSQKIFVVP
jgi:hypothetical protein